MMRAFTRLSVAAAVVGPLSAAALAFAATPAPPTPGAPPAAGAPGGQRVIERQIRRGPGPGPAGQRRGPNEAQREERLATLLQLTPAQQPALKAYLAAMTPPARPERARPAADQRAATPPTTLERLDRQQARMNEMAAAFKTRADATRAFYGQLTASQKKVFDTEVNRMSDRGPRMIRSRFQGGPGGRMPFGPSRDGGPRGFGRPG